VSKDGCYVERRLKTRKIDDRLATSWDLIPLPEVPGDWEDSVIQASESLEGGGREVERSLVTRRAAVPNNCLDVLAVGGVGNGTM
jgi:hypothetical protein